MSKAAALSMLTGQPDATPSGSLITGEIESTAAPTAGAPEVATPTDDLQSNRLAIFAKKEAQIVKEREALKKEREDFLKEKAEADMYRTKGKEFDETRAKDPVAAFKMLGFSDTEIFNFMAGQEKTEPSPEDTARKIAQEEAQKIRDELAKEKEDLTRTQQERLISNLKSDISDKIKSDMDKYEYCAFEGPDAEAQVYEIIVENLKLNGELLSVDDALQMAEEYYETRDKEMAKLKKRQATPATPEAPAAEPVKAASAPAKPKTLTNAVAPSTAATIPRKETPREKKERLIEALKRGSL